MTVTCVNSQKVYTTVTLSAGHSWEGRCGQRGRLISLTMITVPTDTNEE